LPLIQRSRLLTITLNRKSACLNHVSPIEKHLSIIFTSGSVEGMQQVISGIHKVHLPIIPKRLPSAVSCRYFVSPNDQLSSKTVTMKKLFLLAGLMAGVIAFASPVVPKPTEQVLKAFNETFASAKDITWHEYNDFIQANFSLNEVQIRAQYADDGTLLKTIRYYGESNLQPNILAKLKKKYKGKEIYGVTETLCADEASFVINLRDNDFWYTVKSDVFGNLELTDKFKRADTK
jgi:hypothetical protein